MPERTHAWAGLGVSRYPVPMSSPAPSVTARRFAPFGTTIFSEMTALANCFHKELGDADAPLIFTVPSKKLVSGITPTKGINGKHQVIEIEDWKDVSKVISAVAK